MYVRRDNLLIALPAPPTVVAERAAEWETSAVIVADDEQSVKGPEMARSTTRMR